MIKLSISLEELLLILFVGPILLAAVLSIFVFIIRNVTTITAQVRDNFSFVKKMKELNRRKKEEGFMHEWVTVKNPKLGELMICKATGFCPKPYGFFEIKWVREYIETEKKAEQVIKERQNNFQRKLEDLSLEFNINMEQLHILSEKILTINKDFTIKKLEDLKNEIKSKDV